MNVVNKKGEEVEGADIKILDKNGEEVVTGKSDGTGSIEAELPEYSVDGDEITYLSPYTVLTDRKKEEVILNNDQAKTIIVK